MFSETMAAVYADDCYDFSLSPSFYIYIYSCSMPSSSRREGLLSSARHACFILAGPVEFLEGPRERRQGLLKHGDGNELASE